MRLNAYLARAGVASRRKADELIKAGRVTVNGEPGQLNTFVGKQDRVELDGKPLARQSLAYVLLHKPAGVVTTASDPHRRPTVVDLVSDFPVRVVPVGRLDADTTGALLLTNDGELAHRLMHPSSEVEREYLVRLRGRPSQPVLDRLVRGVELDDGPARFDRIEEHSIEGSHSWYRVFLHEGRNREVRRLFEHEGFMVSRLTRIRYGPVELPQDLRAGGFQRLDAGGVARLSKAAGTQGARLPP